MQRVLWLAYHFPPVGGGGVQRSLKFVRDLRAHGYEAVVVTGPGPAAYHWTPADESFLQEIPPGTSVVRLPTPAPVVTPRRRRVDRWLGLEPAFSRWWREGALAAGTELEEVDAVFATLSPYESAEVAIALARCHGVPCVLDLRDPWALDEMTVYPTALHRLREVRRMRAALAAADAVIMNTPEACRAVLERFPELRRSRVVTIPNGFDAQDFAGSDPERSDDRFRIVHTGSLHTEVGVAQRRRGLLRRALGGAEAGVDILTRSHAFLLEAVERVVRADPRSGGAIEVHLAGAFSARDRELLDRRRAPVRVHGYLPHADSVTLVRSADLLFLPMQDLPAGRRARIVPGKTYEYLASGRPILAAVPDGDVRDLLSALGHATVCRPGDVDAMAAGIARGLRLVRENGRAPSRPTPAFAAFERSALAARLAEVLDLVVAARRERPCAAEGEQHGLAAA